MKNHVLLTGRSKNIDEYHTTYYFTHNLIGISMAQNANINNDNNFRNRNNNNQVIFIFYIYFVFNPKMVAPYKNVHVVCFVQINIYENE